MAIFTGGLYFSTGRGDYTDKIIWNTVTGFMFFTVVDNFFQALTPVSIVFPA